MMEKKKVILIIGIILIFSSGILAIFSISTAVIVASEKNAFFETENIHFERFSVEMRDGINIEGLLYVNKAYLNKTDQSTPSLLLIHGINSMKEKDFYKVYNFVKRGYAVYSVELRGHGLSGGISSFLKKEPDDMSQVITHIQTNYKFSNATHMALIGLSFGGGVATILQANDSRIHASAIYHPLSDIDSFTEQVPIQNLIGHTPEISDLNAIVDGYEICTVTNTKNLLLIQGDQDDLVLPNITRNLYKKVGGETRDDIALEIRTGLGHGPNEGDPTSLKYAITWLEHFFHNSSINITTKANRDVEINYVSLYSYSLPSSRLSEDLIWIASILLFFGSCVLILPLKVWPLSNKKRSLLDTAPNDMLRDPEKYKKMIIRRVIFYFVPVLIGGIIFGLFNPSLTYGYLLVIPIATIITLSFIPRSEYRSWKEEWKDWYKKDSKLFLYSLFIIIIPVIFFGVIHNLNATMMISYPVPIFNTTLILYMIMSTCSVMAAYSFVRGFKFKHSMILIGLQSLSVLLYLLFVPIPAIPYLGGYLIHIILISIIGIGMWLILIVSEIFRWIFRSRITVLIIFLLPIFIFVMEMFFRIM